MRVIWLSLLFFLCNIIDDGYNNIFVQNNPSTYYSSSHSVKFASAQVLPARTYAPRFINRPIPLETIVPTKAPPGTLVYKLQARSDAGSISTIRYVLALDRSGGRFEVDERTGEVRTKGQEAFQLDREYLIFVRAEDHSATISYDNPKYPSTAEIKLSIIGGRRPPQFYLENYQKTIPEDMVKDSEVIEIKAKSFSDREIRYTLQTKNKGTGVGTFTIEPTTGKVRLAKELDFEDIRQPQIYHLRVNASEDSGGFTASTDLTITITDVNDNAPRFELPDYQVYGILEDVKIGTKIMTINATDADQGKNAEIEYSIDRNEFTINSKGEIITARRLDADANNTYVLTVRATDKGSPVPKYGTAIVRVYTENTNDEPPKFSQEVYTPNIDENAGSRTLVTTVVASDKDGDNVIYGFAPNTKNPLFQIDERTGVIRLSNGPVNLDRDKYELNITAKDDGKCCEGKGVNVVHTSTALVVVFITDVNDNKPVFEDCASYNPTIYENVPAYTSIMTVKATDLDKGQNGMVRYSIVQQPNQKGSKFVIDEITGEIKSKKVFDRESPLDGRFVSITVKAVDRGNPPLEGVCTFKVEILDVNDNPPLFDRFDYHENLRQGMSIGSHVMRVSAADEDVDLNAMITYSLAPGPNQDSKIGLEYFSINPDTGWISLKKALDKDKFQLQAIASDRGKPSNNATVEINFDVLDRANSPPVWEQPVYTKRVPENEPLGTKIISIKANSGIKNNPNVFYTLIKGNTDQTNKLQTFYITPRTDGINTYADIYLNHQLDYEGVRIYNLTVRVENDGSQQLASECSVNIEVLDVNDEIPLFDEREQQTVLESMPPGTRVSQVFAQDRDGTSPNNVVYYQIDNPDEQNFSIDRKTGEIFTKKEFDREEKQSYSITVRAIDGAPSTRPGSDGRPNSVTTKIRIGIGDKNDNSPYFEKPFYEAVVKEDENIHYPVVTVTARDKDESSKLRYEIVKGNVGGGAFAVNNETGTIYVAGPLDYELRKEYKLVLVASDNLNENYTNVIIKVQDVNDNPPAFERPVYQTTITEGDEKKLPKKILQYNLTVTVSDSLLESSTIVRIKVTDVNDLPPKFEQQTYEVIIFEETPLSELPKSILQVTATDGDRDREQKIIYFLTDQGTVGNDKNEKNVRFFSINTTTGEIFVERPLDRDQPNGRSQWRFTVYAEDEGGHNGLVGYAEVVVNLKDINDNSPVFPNSVYIGNVTERGLANQAVMTMQAVDYDDANEGSNAKLKYSIDQNQVLDDGQLIFRIDEDTGVIYTDVGNLDREVNPEYALKVTATDGGNNQGHVQALIKVKDVNDMPPKFSKKEWYAEVDETQDGKLPETPILIVQVNDGDLLETNRFNYKVLPDSPGAEKFTMVTNSDGTGSLKVAKPLDYEDLAQKYGFNITIEVNDGGEIPDVVHVDKAIVFIKLNDINDNPPEFERPSIEVTVKESDPPKTQLANFTAKDPDQDGRSRVTYAIDRSTDRRKQFRINPITGTVSIQRPLDREEQPRMSIKILALDDGVPQRTATATLTVILTDINDNPPRFLKDYVVIVNENERPGKIGEFQAADSDDRAAGNGPPFHFEMDPNAPEKIKELFEVQHDPTGEGVAHVLTRQTLDREVQKEYQIPVLIRDNGQPMLAGVSNLTVIVGDVNDNKMHPGGKTIFVYNYKGLYKNIPVGRVHVEDEDDWDLQDKKFMWENNIPHPNFALDYHNGTIYMKNVSEGSYFLKFYVSDKKFTQDVAANVTVEVRNLPEEAVYNSGSLRLSGITDEDFIRVWNWKTQKQVQSKYILLRETLSKILKESVENIDIFSVVTHYKRGRIPETDVRFAAHGSPYHKSTFLDGYVAINRRAIEKELGLNITMVGIDECLTEFSPCDGSCYNSLQIEPLPYIVNANRTALVGVHSKVVPTCECLARSYDRIDGCNSQPPFCQNGGKCVMQERVATCECPQGYNGPQCQITSRTFGGKGWAWFSPLEQCENSHLSLEFMTQSPTGLIFYNGPVDAHQEGVSIYEDFISVEIYQGRARLIVDFGSGTSIVEVNTYQELNDGEWHRLDIFWNREEIRMMVDHCKDARFDESGHHPSMNRSQCEQKATIVPYSEFLNVNTPLQIGGIFHKPLNQYWPKWRHNHTREGFKGCIRNFVHNSRTYDLGSPGGSVDSVSGCSVSEDRCQSNSLYRSCEHGQCTGSYKTSQCLCDPGWTGPKCDIESQVKMIQTNGYLRYALSFDPNPFITDIQMRFRTRQKNGELIRITGKNTREFCVLEIRDKFLRFRYHLNQIFATKELELPLLRYNVADGQWHTVHVVRHGSTATIEADGGGGTKFNETTDFGDHHQLLTVNKQSIIVGGDVNHMGPAAYYVENNLHDSCVTDIRIDQRHLPMENGSENAAVTESKLLSDGCTPTNSCARSQINCPPPLVCYDLWNHHECACPKGLEVKNTIPQTCGDLDECWRLSCGLHGTCHNIDYGGGYFCECPSDPYYAICTNCTCDGLMIDPQSSIQIGPRAIFAITTICMFLVLLIIALVFMMRRSSMDPKYGTNDPDDDVRENIISYDDEGGGEDDMHAFDITPLRIPVDSSGTLISTRGKQNIFNKPGILKDLRKGNVYGTSSPYDTGLPGGQFVDANSRLIDADEQDAASRALDDLRNYAYEGCGSTAGSLSSLASIGAAEEEIQDFDYLSRWGPRFQKLAYLYSHKNSDNPPPSS